MRSRRRDFIDIFNDEVPRWLLAVAVGFTLGAVIAMAGCAGPIVVTCHDSGARPYTTEHSVTSFSVTVGTGTPMWFADNRAGTVLTVHNPTDRFVAARVRCHPTDIDGVYGAGWQGRLPGAAPGEDSPRRIHVCRRVTGRLSRRAAILGKLPELRGKRLKRDTCGAAIRRTYPRKNSRFLVM
jgi:hypothetical protein